MSDVDAAYAREELLRRLVMAREAVDAVDDGTWDEAGRAHSWQLGYLSAELRSLIEAVEATRVTEATRR